ncbi:MAG: hypothetical protein AVDCRST_MAG74-1380 [uncultured Pyrinomonadaceae bacterium]|uniref:Uncharacterized protein n=1 Tax=uncultured Pyrinomonadaceae bacterium TaxID=2283094 RepID=A0A6J4NUB2_9BACT|nr:MAG: hypothetical protein AVDCRST_MAG74-1380 [uncultured Pyrinomonadaceae bacterium]
MSRFEQFKKDLTENKHTRENDFILFILSIPVNFLLFFAQKSL